MKQVLITGVSGKIGRNAAKAFAQAGWSVKGYTRGTDMAEAAQGCALIVNGMNPKNYSNWDIHIPNITKAHITAAKATGARVLIPGNVYNYGMAKGPWNADTPQKPCSRKGEIRVEMERAYRESSVPVTILRAGNFIDPKSGDDVLAMMHLARLSRGVIQTPGDPGVSQAWAYVPDWARAAVELAECEELPTWLDLPFAGHTFSVNDMAQMLSSMSGEPLKIKPFPWWVISMTRPVWPLARQLWEMRYLWDLDHRLDDAPLKARLPKFSITPLQSVLAQVQDRLQAPHQTTRQRAA